MTEIEIEINGQKLTAKPDQTVIQVADAAGIYIPRFCYHKKLSVAANCRMCLVEVEKSPKTLPACATPVTPGMKVFTQSAKTIEAQRAVMEFLLINHPLDCPICDQGGECELQDISMGYGASRSGYNECKRAVADEDLGPLIATEMTRCILCTRCVRFGAEVAGMRELGVTYRGQHEEITTFVEQAITSEVSGNIIDLCPVGALTSKPYRFTARAWELKQTPSIAAHDCLNSNIHVHTRYDNVMRVVARENTEINETWLSDRDRFSYTGLHHPDRLAEPLARIEGEWQVVEWQKALELVNAGLQKVLAKHGADQLAALASPNSTIEEFYLLQKLIRGLGSPHIDHRLRDRDTQDQAEMPAFPGLPLSLSELEDADTILLIGSNIQKEQPLAGLRLRKAALKGAAVLAINPVDYAFHFPVTAKKIVAPHLLIEQLTALLAQCDVSASSETTDDDLKKQAEIFATHLRGKQKICILLGALALHHHDASVIRSLAQQIALSTGAQLGFMTDGANTAGGWLAGAVPHRYAGGNDSQVMGLSAYELFEKPRKAYVLMNVEPDLDCANSALAVTALQEAEWVVALSMYKNPALFAHADVILPMASFMETAGTLVNVCGEWQSFTGVAKPYGAARPAWKILRVLGNFLHVPGFDYESVEEVKHEVRASVDKMPVLSMRLSPKKSKIEAKTRLTRIGEIPLYAVDSVVRHAVPLQEIQIKMEGPLDQLRLHAKTAAMLHLQEGDTVRVRQENHVITLPVMFDARIAEDAVWIPGGVLATAGLGDLFGDVEVEKC